jgi:lipopolysaccharide transport system permease protein
MAKNAEPLPVTIIKAPSGWEWIDFKELKEYRDLFYLLVTRDIKIMYAQTVLGFSWAVLNPMIQIVIFTLVFGRIAKIQTDGIPYFLFATVAIIPWTYMSNALTVSSQSLVSGQNMLGKVYFPRLLFPMAPVFAKLPDFFISLIIVAFAMIYYGRAPSASIFYIPLFVLEMIIIPAAMGLWLSAMAVRYRDVKFIVQFLIRMLMFTAPIVYSASSIPEQYRMLYSLNPLVSVIEGMRACMLGLPIPWEFVVPGFFISVLLLVTGAFYFRRFDRVFVDVV